MRRNGDKGFSLLEVMVALGILSIGLLALASLFSSSQRVLSTSNQETLATKLAQDKMEELRTIRPHEIKLEKDEPMGMTREWSIAQNGTSTSRLWIITVKVFPTEDQNQPIVLESMAFD